MPRLRQYGRTHTKHTPPVGHPKLCKWGRQHQAQHTRSPHTHLSKVTLMGHGACLACQTLLRHQTMPMQLGLATNCTDAKTTPLPIAVDNTALCFQHLIRLTHRHTPQRHRHTTLASQKPHLADARTNTHKSTMALAPSPRRLGPCKGDTHGPAESSARTESCMQAKHWQYRTRARSTCPNCACRHPTTHLCILHLDTQRCSCLNASRRSARATRG